MMTNDLGRRGGCTILFPIMFLIGLLASCGGGDSPPPQPRPQPQPTVGWQFLYSPNMPSGPTGYNEGWYFDFPTSNGVHYLVQGASGRIGNVSAAFKLDRENNAQLIEVEPCGDNAPKMRLYFQRRGDDMTGAGPMEFYRWWSRDTFNLNENGPSGLTAPVQPEKWSSVYSKSGDQVPNEFAAAVADVQAVGLTFGGCFAGHGIYASGPVRFFLNSFSFQ